MADPLPDQGVDLAAAAKPVPDRLGAPPVEAELGPSVATPRDPAIGPEMQQELRQPEGEEDTSPPSATQRRSARARA